MTAPMPQRKPRVAVIGTGGTIASVGVGPLDILDYGANETMLHVDELIERFPAVHDVADIVPYSLRSRAEHACVLSHLEGPG